MQLPSPDYVFDIEKSIIGTPSEVRERLQRYVDMGCRRFELMFMDYPIYKSLEFFSSTVFLSPNSSELRFWLEMNFT